MDVRTRVLLKTKLQYPKTMPNSLNRYYDLNETQHFLKEEEEEEKDAKEEKVASVSTGCSYT